jgi:hypothetical protein
MRTRLHIVTLAVAVLLFAPSAEASRDQTVLFEAPRDLINVSAAVRAHALSQLDSLGVHALRIVLYWRDVAPASSSRRRPSFDATSPSSYNWSRYDPAVQAAAARGWQILLTVSGPVPRWATPHGVDNLTRPDPLDFGHFMTAVGRHYGSSVKLFSIWNEPNEPAFLLPQYVHGRPVSPRVYRALYQAGYAGLRAASNAAGAKVLFGETAPRGTGHVVAPLTFLRLALCLDSSYHKASTCSALPMDGYAHHAYTTLAGPFFKPSEPNDVTIAVLPRLVDALNRAGAAGAIPSNTPLYLTEFGIQSFPDIFNGVPLAQQAEYQAIAEHIAWANPRVAFFSQYLLRDDPPSKGNIFRRNSGFDTGLELSNGRAKPSYRSWPVPLLVRRRGARVAFWGGARPAAGSTTVTIEASDGGGAFRTLLTKSTDSLGYFTASSSYKRGRRWRLRWVAPGGAIYTGSPIRAYATSGRVQP